MAGSHKTVMPSAGGKFARMRKLSSEDCKNSKMDTNRMGISKMATSRMEMDINNRIVDISSSGREADVEMANSNNSNSSTGDTCISSR